MNKSIQDRIREEVKATLDRTGGKVTYDAVMTEQMPFLDQIVSETLRMYPILPILDRECVKPDGFSMEPFSDFVIPRGMPIYVPVFALHRDEKYYPEPSKFDPSRFSPENIDKIQPFTYFPFGAGPRNCIGKRFALMQVKTALVKILKDFRLETTEKTPKEIVLEKSALVVQADTGLFLSLVKDPLY